MKKNSAFVNLFLSATRPLARRMHSRKHKNTHKVFYNQSITGNI
jgi:hypothetical protein